MADALIKVHCNNVFTPAVSLPVLMLCLCAFPCSATTMFFSRCLWWPWADHDISMKAGFLQCCRFVRKLFSLTEGGARDVFRACSSSAAASVHFCLPHTLSREFHSEWALKLSQVLPTFLRCKSTPETRTQRHSSDFSLVRARRCRMSRRAGCLCAIKHIVSSR